MILPIISFGSEVLRERCVEISSDYIELQNLINNMWETMYNAQGVGLAAPKINKSIRLFLIDTTPFIDDEDIAPIKKVFINPRIINETGDLWVFNEGCLSIPQVREDITRKSVITIEYQDESFNKYTESFDGITARVIQHEYDHIEGVLFIDRISQLRKRMIKGKLMDISKGKITTSYKMKFVK